MIDPVVAPADLNGQPLIYTGCNVENASYGLTICAERCAILSAVAAGYRKFDAIAVATDQPEAFTFPCGACLQVLAEFGDFPVFCVKPDGSHKQTRVRELLPFTFTKKDLMVVQQVKADVTGAIDHPNQR